MYRTYGKNKDGFIDFNEFIIVLIMLSSGSAEEKLLQMFDICDTHRTGYISQLEMRKLVREMFNCIDSTVRPPRCNPVSFSKLICNEMDGFNRDGQISKQEFIRAYLDDDSFSSVLAIKLLENISAT